MSMRPLQASNYESFSPAQSLLGHGAQLKGLPESRQSLAELLLAPRSRSHLSLHPFAGTLTLAKHRFGRAGGPVQSLQSLSNQQDRNRDEGTNVSSVYLDVRINKTKFV
jgi:hypothetical protein